MFDDFYRGKTVLVTGHTGFKGSWLAIWLTTLGAKVVGYALEPPSEPSNFAASRLAERITHIHGDVRDHRKVEETLREHQPDVVFHLAAQALVRRSYVEPRETFEVNVMGTVNVLEAARRAGSVTAFVSITSDKCYRNLNWPWGYRETDELGGYDAYSASKACAELAIGVYQDDRFQRSAPPVFEMAVASVRAGNVIGGGDWAADRVVPDTVRALADARDVVIRSPDATRPWQHVLEPLSGYLWLGSRLSQDRDLCTSWNFGPRSVRAVKVEQVVRRILELWPAPAERLRIERDGSYRESLLLQLDCSKAHHYLGWHATWEIDETLAAIVAWYRRFYERPEADMFGFTARQIEEYAERAREQELSWARR